MAVKYEMDHLDIDVLKDDPDAGSKTLSFLESANPELKVYDFCKTLKEYNIRRNDIVQILLDHLSVAG